MPNTPTQPRPWERQQAAFLRRIAVHSHFHRVFDALPDTKFFVKNRQGQTLFVSKEWPAHHGFRHPDEMLGKKDRDLTPGPLAEHYLADDAIVYRTGEPLLHRVELCRDEVGLPDWYVTNKFPIKDRRGRVIGIMGTSRWCGGIAPPSSPSARIAPAIKLLRDELACFPPPATLAKACHLSVRQLQRCFEEAFGISPHSFWIKCRIRAACESLRQGAETLAAIAQRLGFCDQSNFTAHFRKHTGQTPKSFRQSAAEAATPRATAIRPSRGSRG